MLTLHDAKLLSPAPLLSEAVSRTLRPRFRGELILPDAAGYDDARRLWNKRFDKRPSLIARCTGVAEVREIVRFARANGLPAAVRSGRHDLFRRCVMDGEISIDLSPMQGVRVDPAKRTVRAQAGVRWRELTRELQAFGFAAGGPMDSSVTVKV